MAISICKLRGFLCLVALLSLTACAHFPVTSMYKLRNFNPATTNVDQLRFAVRIPDDSRIEMDSLWLFLGTEHNERAPLHEEYKLEPVDDRRTLNEIERPATKVNVYRVALKDVDRFNRLREKIRLEKSHGADGTLEVKADVCRVTAELPPRIPISTFVNASETSGYVTLLRDVDMLDGADRETALELSPICEDL